MTTEKRTIQQFIDAHELKMEAREEWANPNNHPDDEIPNAMHFEVRVTGPDGAMTCHYSVGPGIVESFLKGKYPNDKMLFARGLGRGRTIHDDEFYRAHHREYRPDFESVLDCLASDASSYESARDFPDWASDFGYSDDSIKAEATWDAIEEGARDLRRLLGLDSYRQLIEDIERL